MSRTTAAADHSSAEPPAYELLGVRVNLMTILDMQRLIGAAVAARERLVMVSQNLHSVYQFHRDAELRESQARASYIRIDGLPLVIFGKLLGFPIARKHRTGWMDWLDPFMSEAQEHGWRVFYLGSAPDVAERGELELRQRYPRLGLMVHHGYFDMDPESDANLAVRRAIDDFATDIVIVGMGMPRQERWILANENEVSAPVFVTAGACLDYVAGVIPTPPRWLGRLGFEWLFRLISEPRRLWRRYLLEPWFAGALFIRDLWRRRRIARVAND